MQIHLSDLKSVLVEFTDICFRNKQLHPQIISSDSNEQNSIYFLSISVVSSELMSLKHNQFETVMVLSAWVELGKEYNNTKCTLSMCHEKVPQKQGTRHQKKGSLLMQTLIFGLHHIEGKAHSRERIVIRLLTFFFFLYFLSEGREGKRAGGILAHTEKHRGRNFQWKLHRSQEPLQKHLLTN